MLLWSSCPHGPEFPLVQKLLAYIILFNQSYSCISFGFGGRISLGGDCHDRCPRGVHIDQVT